MERSGLYLQLTLLSALLLGSCTGQNGSPAIPKPLDPGKDVLGYLAIPSLEKLLQDGSSLANLAAPGKTTPEMLKSQIGSMLGDPGLKNMDLTRPVVVLLEKPKQAGALPSFAAILPAREAAPYDQALAGMGLQTRFKSGLLLAAQTPEGLEAASAAQGLYRELAGARMEKSARFHLQAAGLMEAYGPLLESQLDGFLKTMAALSAAGGGASPVPQKTVATILKLEATGLLFLLKQCEAAQIDLGVVDQKIAMDCVVTARTGTALADCFSKSSRSGSPSAGLVGRGGFMTAAVSCNARSVSDLLKQVLEAVSREPEAEGIKEVTSLFLAMGDWWGGAAAFTMRPGKDCPFFVDWEAGVVDEAALRAAMETAMRLVSPGGALSNLYKEMGLEISLKLEKGARQHAGISIDRWKYTLDTSKAPLEMDGGLIKAMLRDVELALVKGRLLASNDASRLDSMIDEVQSSARAEARLLAEQAFGPGRQAYLDYNVIGLLKAMSGLSENPAMQVMKTTLDKVKSPEPMVFAVTFGEARAELRMSIPLAPFAQMAVAGK
jgi:hypothetical protein